MRTTLALLCLTLAHAPEVPLDVIIPAVLSPVAVANITPPLEISYPEALPPLPRGKWITVIATGYSPHDAIDSKYRATKGDYRWKTATLTDVRDQPYGVAVPFWRIKRGAAIYVPEDSGYVGKQGRIFEADDTGGDIRSNTRDTGITHIDLRFRTEASAKKYGRRKIKVFVYRETYDTVISQTANKLIDNPER